MNYREKYKAMGVCVSHPSRKVVLGQTHCVECMEKRHKGGAWYSNGRSSTILGIRVQYRMLERVQGN